MVTPNCFAFYREGALVATALAIPLVYAARHADRNIGKAGIHVHGPAHLKASYVH